MANRHLSRSIVLQSLFEWDFNKCDNLTLFESILKRNFQEFAPGVEDISFSEKLAKGILDNLKKIDNIITKAAPEWPLEQIAIVDRNVLRIGLYELVFGNRREAPPKVAINEAIELAKTFGGESSGKFINGVLGTVFRELGLPEEEKMPEENLSGAVVYKKEGNDFLFALVHDVFGYWTLSKGHIEQGESEEDGAKREINEEIGINIKIEDKLGKNEYIASDPEKGRVKKIVTYYLASTKDKNLRLKESGGLDGTKWFKAEELNDLKIYDDIRPIFAKAIRILSNK